MRKKKISIRITTTVSQKLLGDWCEKNKMFLEFPTKNIKENKLSRGQIINMDEVLIAFD